MKVPVLTLLACAVAVIQLVEAQDPLICKCIPMYIVFVYKNKAYFELIWFHNSLFLLQLK